MQTLVIPRYHPPSLNRLLRMHWAARRRRKRECDDLVATYARQQGLTRAVGKRRLTMTLRLRPGQNELDDDNAQKLILDACVACGLLIDDCRQWLERTPVRYERGTAQDWGTRLDFEDLPAE